MPLSNRGEEVYRFVEYDQRDISQIQFYLRTINNALYLNFTYINPVDVDWMTSLEANDRFGFYQDDDVRSTVTVSSTYDAENGYRIEAAPAPALNLGQIYEIAPSVRPPPDRIPTPPENRGWSPLYAIQYLTFDGTTYALSNTPQSIFAFRLADWTSGQGVKPQLGYLGINGLVGDVNDAAILQLPTGPTGVTGERGTRWTQQTTLPTSGQVVGDMNLFPEAVASGLVNYFQADGTTAKADASAGEVARWDGTKWRFVMVLSVGGLSDSGLFVDMHDGLRDATAEDYGKVGIGPDGKLYRVKRTAAPGHDAAGTFNAYSHAQYRGVAHNRPSNPQDGEIYYNIRIHQWYLFFINRVVSTIDAQPITPVQALGANTIWLGEVDDIYQARHAIQNFDNTKAYYAVWGETLYVLDNSTYTAATTGTTYTYQWVESLPDNIITLDELTAALESYGFSFIEVSPRNARIDELYKSWIVSLGQVYPPYNTANRVEIFLDAVKVYDAAWNPAVDRFIKFDISNANATTIKNNTQSADTHWPVELRFFNSTTRVGASKFTSVVISREPEPNPFDNEIIRSLEAKTADLLVQTRETWAAATDASFLALPADNAQLARVRAGNIPIGLTGWTTDVTTTEPRVILLRVPLNAQLADYRILLGDNNAVRLDTYGVDATGTQYAYLTPTSFLQDPTRIRLQHHGTDTHTNFIGMIANIAASAVIARLLPPLDGAEAGQAVQVNSEVTGYILGALAAGGLSADQLARLVPDFSSEPDGDFLRLVSGAMAWDAAADLVTQTQLRDYRQHTPESGDTLPVYIPPQRTFVLQKTSHWSDKLYPFYPIGREIVIGGRTFNDIGTIEVSLSSEITPFESTDNPNPQIFNAARVAGIYMRSTNATATEAGYAWRPKIVLDRALFPNDQGAYDYSGLSIRMRVGYEGFGQYHHAALYHSAFNRDGDELSGAGVINELVAGGKTYVCFVPDNRNFHWRQFLGNAANNNAEVSFQILKSESASPVFPPTDPQFLSDDPTTAWVDGDEFETGLYEGDANGHPVARILPSLEIWNEILTRLGTTVTVVDPVSRDGENGNWWYNARQGKLYQKQSGTWVLVADFALQSDLGRAPEWSSLPNNRQVPNDLIVKVGTRYFGSKTTHTKTSGSTAPTGDTTNWVELSNEATTGSSAQTLVWADIPSNQSIPLGTLVNHGGLTFAAIVTHNKIATGPDGDATNWIAVTNYGGTWSAKWWPIGIFVVHGGNPYVSTQVVSASDVAPDHASNTKWLRLNTDVSNVGNPEAWTDIANGTAIPIGKIVTYDGEYYGAFTAHNKAASPTPNTNDSQWRLLSSYLGGWRSGAFPEGSIVERGGHYHIAVKDVPSGQASPTAANQTNWRQIDNEPPVSTEAVFAELGISASLTIPQPNGTAIPLTYAASLEEEHNSSGIIGRATAGNAITLKAGTYVIDVDLNVSTESSGENARSNIEFTLYNGSTLLKTKRSGYLRSLTVFDEQSTSTRFTIDFASDATIQIRVKMHDNDLGTPTITTQAGGEVTVTRIGT